MHSVLGHCDHPAWYLHMHKERWGLANPHSHHLMHTCKEGENGMGWHVLGIWVQQKTWKMRNQHGDQFPWTQNDSWMECFNT